MQSIPFHPPGVTYNGLHGTPNPTAALVAADLATTKQHSGHVRTYYPQYGGGAVDVGKIAKDINLALLLGLFLFDGHPDWIADNYEQFVKPAVARGNIAGILIGNEDPQIGISNARDYLTRVTAWARHSRSCSTFTTCSTINSGSTSARRSTIISA